MCTILIEKGLFTYLQVPLIWPQALPTESQVLMSTSPHPRCNFQGTSCIQDLTEMMQHTDKETLLLLVILAKLLLYSFLLDKPIFLR